ncbi:MULTISPECIES: AzlD domain-containing protein [unclassified Corynebacterium]|jgi:integral membrane amino acid transport protein|uniref:branched-chain amino acid transporter permease n=1 Tax=unclassified Corynebacterium TaxID=2624378 RepID=UPI001EF5D0A1|nr:MULTISPECIES: AzlD domain-containing protein [unclassified Corynebacterium]MCG7243538.1 AzlD domain-containing protein [Corynebacterium sp. ACRPS]MCG7271776.1 AzlD domain-containing protein [Corynebacterium sp. ACRQM]MCG7233755.1 AzlD domain-containing protein [Corynebacterium sp. ACRPR]MDK8474536.1 AzlD domain-containing protein [Corynebacterium sp. MSK078]MDK8659584.1 AzlD domain-containing protein [Corynebacterium sp. MSK204]
MPDGVSLGAIAAVLIPVGIVTVLLRELPFSAKKWMKDSEFFSLLGLMMPVGVMTILVVYAVAGQADGTGGLWPVLLGVLVTVGLHKWKRDSGLSIFGGTAFYMILVNLVL